MRHVEWIRIPNQLGQTTGWKLYRLERDWVPTGDDFVDEAEVRQYIVDADDLYLGYGPLDSTQPTVVYGGNDVWVSFDPLPTWQGYLLVPGKGWEALGDWVKAPEILVRRIVQRAATLQRGLVLGYGPADQDRPTVAYAGSFFENPREISRFAMEGGLPTGLPAQFGDLPFPTPSMPGVDVSIATQAMDAIRKAALACPQLSVPGGALQNAAIVFGIFAATSDQQKSLNTLQAELDRICPTWRGKDLGTLPSIPPALPTGSADVATLLGQLASALLSGAIGQLPALAQKARDLGLPDLGQAIDDYQRPDAGGPPPPPPPPSEPPPPTPPPPTKKKDEGVSTGGLIAAGLAVLAIGAILFG